MISPGVLSRQFIGRSRELAFLLERADPATRRGGCVLVRGEAGLGKTRLVNEFAAAAAERGTKVVLGATRVYANRPYAAFLDVIEALQAAPPPVPEDAGLDGRTAWFERVATILRGTVGAAGATIVIEDLHWADAATLDLLRYCAVKLAHAPIVFVATYRSDEVERDSARERAFAALERDVDTLTLMPLAPGQTEHLIRSALADTGTTLPQGVVAEVRDLAEGRPLFAEELLRGVLERLGRNEHARPSVPPSVRASVRERFLALAEPQRELLLDASLFGRRFSARRVQRLSGTDEPAALAALRRARDLQLIVEDPADPDGDAFEFRHALTREAVYAEMLRAEARGRHARVAAQLIEEKTPDAAAIAEHTWRARAGENAALWNERAGDDAAAVFAFAEAARAYERSAASTADPARRARVSEHAAQAAYHTGDIETAAHWFGEAARALLAVDRPDDSVRVALLRSRILTEAGQSDLALREAEQLAEAPHAAAHRFRIETHIAGQLCRRGRAHDALERLRRVEPLAAAAEPAAIPAFLGAYGYALSLAGETAAARERFAGAIAAAHACGALELEARTYNNWATLEFSFGPVSRACELHAAGLAVATAMKHARHVAWMLHNRLLCNLVAGDLGAADADLARIDTVSHGIRSLPPWRAAAKLRLHRLREGTSSQLQAEARRLLDDARAHGDLPGVAILSGVLAATAGADGDASDAQQLIAAGSAAIPIVYAPFWLLDAALRWGTAEDRDRARARLVALSAIDGSHAARAFLLLAESREAARRRDRIAAQGSAAAAAAEFGAIGWRLDEAYAWEAAGNLPAALAIFRSTGAAAEVRRLTESSSGARRRGDASLTAREREVAALVVSGRSARAIGTELVISERTVETHVAAIYRKLGVDNRIELAKCLVAEAASQTSVP